MSAKREGNAECGFLCSLACVLGVEINEYRVNETLGQPCDSYSPIRGE